ncbi:uncharacterized protein LOC117652823 isoform X2 [Thrips palmi]|uniref:Uncharacterized protein LOC117652823 isoform X2 n=1 Tax=Thrips palmi TaxID=161013 RepID=A0A6P9A7G7_THRPL|nr:uncharacterized protein LOC117652823 isoform X2 [Thrips palmi]
MTDYNAHGYVMSTSQLNDLWHYDMWLGHFIMDLPLRRCKAMPKNMPNFPEMGFDDFQKLKDQVREMWITASHIFTAKKGPYGWGLFFREEQSPFGRVLTEKKPLTLGWLARVPSPDMCPTGHRYLRSPTGEEKYPVYLGGPISIANYDKVDRVLCRRLISQKEPNKNKMGVCKGPKRKLSPGQEVLWSYNFDPAAKRCPNFFPENEWQPILCCSELLQKGSSFIPSLLAEDLGQVEEHDDPPSKRRKVGGQRPLIKTACILSHRYCTYCEMGVDPNNVNTPLDPKDFIKHLDKVDHVFNSLNSHNYKVVPACKFFEVTNTTLLPPDASTEEKVAVFQQFLDEGMSAFKKYQVVYLKGIKVPQSYDDLLKSEVHSSYDKISWKTDKPSGNNFSLSRYNITDVEQNEHTLNIRTHLINAIVAWSRDS